MSWLRDLNWLGGTGYQAGNTNFNPVKYVETKVIPKQVVWVENKLQKIDKIADATLKVVDNSIEAVEGAASTVSDLLSGKSHFLVYAGLGVVALVLVPIVLKKAL